MGRLVFWFLFSVSGFFVGLLCSVLLNLLSPCTLIYWFFGDIMGFVLVNLITRICLYDKYIFNVDIDLLTNGCCKE